MRTRMGSRRKSESTPEEATGLFDSMLDHSAGLSGDATLLTGPEADASIIGLWLPALALRYMYQSNVKPLGRSEIITGLPHSCKSAYLYEQFAWHRTANGGGWLCETENKDSPELRLSLTSYDAKAVRVSQFM